MGYESGSHLLSSNGGRAMTPEEVEAIVQGIVFDWLSALTGVSAGQIDPTLTFLQAPPGGYSLSPGAYQTMCNDCTTKINASCHSNVSLGGPWRSDHELKPIAVFIADVAGMV
jgi:hypothetical protein